MDETYRRRCAIERLDARRLMAATPALWAAGGGAYLTEFDPTTGAVLATVTPPAGTGTAGITADAADADGDLFVVDTSSGDILRVDGMTHVASVFVAAGTGGLTDPIGVAVARDGVVAAIDQATLYAFSATGGLLAKVTTGQAADYQVSDNVGVAAGPDGLFYLFQLAPRLTSAATNFAGQRYEPSTLAKVGSTVAERSDPSTNSSPVAYDFGAGGTLYFTENEFYAPNGQDVIPLDLSSDRSINGGVSVGALAPSSDQVAVDATNDIFVASSTGGIDVRSAETGDVIRSLASPAAGTEFGLPVYVPTNPPNPPGSVAFDRRHVAHLVTSEGTVTARLSGPGSGLASPDPTGAAGVTLTLTGTTAATAISLAVPADAMLERLASPGPIGSLFGPRVVLAGDVSIGGTTPVRVSLGAVTAGSSLTAVGPIESLAVASWAAGTADDPSTVTAPSVGSLVCRGSFSADVVLTSPDLSLARASFGSLSGASIQTAGSVGTVRVAGNVTDSRFEVDATATATTQIATFGDAVVRLGRFTQRWTATFSDSQIAAYSIGTASLGRATSTDGTLTGVAGRLIAAVRIHTLQGGRPLRQLDGLTQPVLYDEANVVVQVF